MESNKSYKFLYSLTIGAIVAALFVAVVTIAGDFVKDQSGATIIKNWLKDAHYHHWVGKGIWALISGVAVGLMFYLFKSTVTVDSIRRSVNILSGMLILGSIAITAFFTLEYFHLL